MANNNEGTMPTGVEYCSQEPDQVREKVGELGEIDSS